MVVASNTKEQSYGNASETTPVKKPLMILASVPRKLTPTERFTLPVNVFVMDKSLQSVDIKLKTNQAFKIIGPSSKTIKFQKIGDQIVNFEIEVLAGTSIGEINVQASSKKEKAKYNVEIDVINPNLPITKLSNFEIPANGSLSIPFSTFGETGTNTLDLEFSDFPSFNMNGRLRNLIGYPYGCLEQTTSKAFPQLSLLSIGDLSNLQKDKVESHIKFALNKLTNFQNANGGLSYWPHSSYYESWAEVYAGHFILDAESNGFKLPYGFKQNYLRHLKLMAKKFSSGKNSKYNTLTQAYRLFILALSGQPEISAMNRLKESKALNKTSTFTLAKAYAILGQKNVALEMIENIKDQTEPENYKYYRYTLGSKVRDKAFILETYISLDLMDKAKIEANYISKILNSTRWMSTQSTAVALHAMAMYSKKIKANGLDYEFSINKTDKVHTKSEKGSELFSKDLTEKNQNIKIKNNKNRPLFVSMINGGLPLVGDEEYESRGLNVSVSYKDMDGKIIAIDSLKQGTNFYAELYISNPSDQNLSNVALSQLFPSGWEIVNTRFNKGIKTTNTEADFKDIRDDRVNYFMSLKANSSKKFSILLNASYLGEYYFPGAHAETMYDNDYLVKMKGKRIKVVL